jgi:uncharacterized membrane protein YgcG
LSAIKLELVPKGTNSCHPESYNIFEKLKKQLEKGAFLLLVMESRTPRFRDTLTVAWRGCAIEIRVFTKIKKMSDTGRDGDRDGRNQDRAEGGERTRDRSRSRDNGASGGGGGGGGGGGAGGEESKLFVGNLSFEARYSIKR